MRPALRLALIVFLPAVFAQARSLPPSAFPELPGGIASELEQRGCRIPQVKRNQRSNLIQGDFVHPGETAWAVVCKTRTDNILLVFVPGADARALEVYKVRNGLYKDMSISVVDRQKMLDFAATWNAPKPLPSLDHGGISYWLGPRNPDSRSFSDNAAEGGLFYFDGSKWAPLGTMIAN
jgi:hypothetical protein